MTDKPETAAAPAAAAPAPVTGAAARKQRPLGGGVRFRAPLLPLVAFSVIVAFLSIAHILQDDGLLVGKTFTPSIVALIWLGCYLLTSYLAFGTPYLFSTGFVICLFVFHFGLLMQDGLGAVKLIAWMGPMGAWAVRAGWYTNLALACLGAGFGLYGMNYRARKAPPPKAGQALVTENFGWIRHQGIGLLLASLVLLAGAFATQGNIFALTRLELFHFSDTRFISVFSMMAPSAAIALVVGSKTPGQRLVGYGVAALVFLFFLISGQRSTAFFPLLAGAIMWVKSGRRINPVVAIASILGVLLVIPVVGYLRTMGTYGDITNADAIAQADRYADIRAALGEMGGSIGPLMYTLMIVPEDEPYRYGMTYVRYLSDIIPNVGFQADQSTSRASAAASLNSGPTEKALLEMQPGDWASYHIIRDQFEKGGGAGYSGVAEPYFNFGMAGVLVFFMGMGAFLAAMDCRPLLLHRYWLLFGASIYWHLLPIVRNDFGIFVKPAVFTVIIIVVWRIVRRFAPGGPKAGVSRVFAAQPPPAPPLKRG